MKSNKKIREYYTTFYKDQGADALYEQLMKRDPEACKKIHKNNVKRVIRALEVCDITGKKFSDLNTDIRKPSPEYDSILIGLSMERKVLYERINQRVDEMLSQGLVEEVRSLLEKGYGKDLVSMRGIGYKEIIAYLEGSMDYDQAVSLLKQNTRRFAKRQYTWFLKDENVKWFRMDKAEEIDNTIKDIETYISTRLN